MEPLLERCAGLDIHKKTVVACRLTPSDTRNRSSETRTFGTTTRELLQLADWLRTAAVTDVAMESTGVYWKPVFNILESQCQVLLVNAKHIKQVPGRKTDVKDAEWIAQLLQHGLLRASYIPEAPQRDLRDLVRYRTKLIQDRSSEVNRVQKGAGRCQYQTGGGGQRCDGRFSAGHAHSVDRGSGGSASDGATGTGTDAQQD